MGIFASALKLKHMVSPPTPPAGESLLYPKSDGMWYTKNAVGLEAPTFGRAEDTGWINMTLLNGWSNWGGGWAVGRYRRVNGIVYVEGFLNAANRTASQIAVLPEGFRPKEHTSNAVPGINQTNKYTAISVTSAGSIEIQGGYSDINSSWLSLGTISYAVDVPTSFVVGDDTGWIPAPLVNGWVDYGSNWTGARYRRVNGMVYLQGVVKNGTAPGTIFTLPEGFRPGGGSNGNIIAASSSTGSEVRIDVLAGGAIYNQSSVNGYVSLADIPPFPAESSPVAFVSTAPLAAYPVGAVFISVVNTNPGTIFGGTWSAFATGRTLVGVDTAQTEFNTVEKTGGVKTVTLTAAQSGSPAHSHGITDPGHTHNITFRANATALGDWSLGLTNGTGSVGSSTGFAPAQATGITINNSTATNATASHENLQPYITVYMWKRTA